MLLDNTSISGHKRRMERVFEDPVQRLVAAIGQQDQRLEDLPAVVPSEAAGGRLQRGDDLGVRGDGTGRDRGAANRGRRRRVGPPGPRASCRGPRPAARRPLPARSPRWESPRPGGSGRPLGSR